MFFADSCSLIDDVLSIIKEGKEYKCEWAMFVIIGYLRMSWK